MVIVAKADPDTIPSKKAVLLKAISVGASSTSFTFTVSAFEKVLLPSLA